MTGATPNRTACQVTPADSGLRCPKCEYNLTGVTESRCPECGEAFDPEQLRAILESAPAPIPIWDDKEQFVIVRFIHMCLLTWFLPHRLSRRFPQRYSYTSARRFRWLAVLVAVAVWVVQLAIRMNGEGILIFLAGAGGYLAGVITCEALLSAAFWAFLWPAATPNLKLANPTASETFNGLVGMFRSFVILESLALAIASLGHSHYPMVNLPGPAALAIPLWWMAALAGAIAAQPGSLSGKVFSLMMVFPFVVTLSVFFAIFVGYLCFAAVYGLSTLFT